MMIAPFWFSTIVSWKHELCKPPQPPGSCRFGSTSQYSLPRYLQVIKSRFLSPMNLYLLSFYSYQYHNICRIILSHWAWRNNTLWNVMGAKLNDVIPSDFEEVFLLVYCDRFLCRSLAEKPRVWESRAKILIQTQTTAVLFYFKKQCMSWFSGSTHKIPKRQGKIHQLWGVVTW